MNIHFGKNIIDFLIPTRAAIAAFSIIFLGLYLSVKTTKLFDSSQLIIEYVANSISIGGTLLLFSVIIYLMNDLYKLSSSRKQQFQGEQIYGSGEKTSIFPTSTPEVEPDSTEQAGSENMEKKDIGDGITYLDAPIPNKMSITFNYSYPVSPFNPTSHTPVEIPPESPSAARSPDPRTPEPGTPPPQAPPPLPKTAR